jgi:hypothetical protein
MYLEGILMYVKYKNIFLVADRCILKEPLLFIFWINLELLPPATGF